MLNGTVREPSPLRTTRRLWQRPAGRQARPRWRRSPRRWHRPGWRAAPAGPARL